MRVLYAILFLLGAILPFTAMAPWLSINGLDFYRMIKEALSSPVSAFAWLDVLVSVVVLLIFIVVEGTRLRMRKLWLPIVGTLAVGVSFGLPLFLFMREKSLQRRIF